jgi:hypothetical protein
MRGADRDATVRTMGQAAQNGVVQLSTCRCVVVASHPAESTPHPPLQPRLAAGSRWGELNVDHTTAAYVVTSLAAALPVVVRRVVVYLNFDVTNDFMAAPDAYLSCR